MKVQNQIHNFPAKHLGRIVNCGVCGFVWECECRCAATVKRSKYFATYYQARDNLIFGHYGLQRELDVAAYRSEKS